MMRFREPVLLPLLLLLACTLPAYTAEPYALNGPRQAHPARTPSASLKAKAQPPKLLDLVNEKYRDAVGQVLKSPTISAKATEEEFAVHATVYDWLLAHPDRTSVAWQRLDIPCVDITDLGKGHYYWSDESGSELSWQTVGNFENGVIWFATGKVKAGMLLPTIPVKAVAVLQSPRSETAEDGTCRMKPTLHVSIQCDSKFASMAMKLAGSSAPKMAEEGAEQLLLYFSGIARSIYRKPEKLEFLLSPVSTTSEKNR